MSGEEALAQARGKTNEETLALMKSTEGLQVTTEQISKVEQASTRIGKLKSGALQAVSTVANMASFALIGVAIGGIITLVDNWIHRSERANQAMKEAVSEYESTKSRLEDLSTELDQHNQKIEELEAKGHLTYVEKGQLEELQKITRELKVQKDIEEKKAERESKEVANKTVDAYEEQYGKDSISKEKIETSMEYDTYVASEIANKDDVVGNITAYVKNKELLKETEDKIKKAIDAKQDISSLERDRQFYIDEIGAYESLLDSNLGDLQEKHITLEEEYQKASQKSERDRTTSDKNIIDTYKESGEAIKLIYEYKDPNTWNDMEISDIFAKEGMEGKKEELIESAKESKLTPKKIKEDQNLFEAIKESEIIGEREKEKIKEVQDQLEAIGESKIIGEREKEKIKEAQDQLEAIREREIIGEREKEKIKKVQDQLEAIGESKIIGEREKEKIKEAQDQLEAIRESEIIEDDEQKKLEAFCEEINNSAQALKEMEAIANEPISISDKFEQLWSSDPFTSAREELEKLSKESGITAENIQSLATENQDFAALLEETGISADFAATCFQRVCEGADGFSSITEDALALDEVLSVMDENLAAVAAAKSEYDKAMQEEDYNAEFQDYQEAYQKGMEMFEKGEYGKHFRSTMEYLFGEDSYRMSIEEMRSAMEGLQNIFGEDSKNGLEFFDALYEKRELLEELNSSLEKQEDGTYKINLKPEELEEIAEIMGLTTEQVTACVNAYGMYGENVSYNIEDLKEALKGMSIAVEDGETSLLSLQKVQQMLSDRGYDNWTISKILQDIQQMEGVKLLDFEVSGEEELQAVLTQLQELDLVTIDGKNIHVDTLITNLRETFGLAYEDIAVFLKNLEGTYQLSDTEGKAVSVEEAKMLEIQKKSEKLQSTLIQLNMDKVSLNIDKTMGKVFYFKSYVYNYLVFI